MITYQEADEEDNVFHWAIVSIQSTCSLEDNKTCGSMLKSINNPFATTRNQVV